MSRSDDLEWVYEENTPNGAVHYFRMNTRLMITSGVKRMADEDECYWLLDLVSSHLRTFPVTEWFAVVELEKIGEGCQIRITDDIPARQTFVRQNVPVTDFPRDSAKLFLAKVSDLVYVLMLPEEY